MSSISMPNGLIQKYYLHIIIFLCSLFFIITISNPAVFFNDEWITLNQLRQMDSGHQVIISEGTYGVFKNGTSTPYFSFREQYLGYTLMLPVLSWPVLKFFSLFGDNFRFPVIFFWALIPILIMLLLEKYRPDIARLGGVRWTWIVLATMICLFCFNMIFYYPFPFTGATSPREIAAVVFTQHILFAILAVVIFSIFSLLSKNSWFSLFGLIMSISGSSYIFWAANGKDHLLFVTIFAICIFFMVRYILDKNYLDGVSGFIAIGLLAWARPETALSIFMFSAFFVMILNLRYFRENSITKRSLYKNCCLPFYTVFGAVPFFLNNLYISGNPFIPTFLAYLNKKFGVPGADTTGNLIISNVSVDRNPVSALDPLVQKLVSYFTVKSPNFFGDVFALLFGPESGGMSIAAVAPLILIIILIILIIFLGKKSINGTTPVNVFWYLLCLFIAIPLTYIGTTYSLNISQGMTPDVRYLSPIYLVISLGGILLVNSLFPAINWKKITKITLFSVIFLLPAIFLIIFLSTTGGSAIDYTRFFKIFSLAMAGITTIILILTVKYDIDKEYFILFLGALIVPPLFWQILLTYFFAIAKFNGYPFWIPVMELIYNYFF